MEKRVYLTKVVRIDRPGPEGEMIPTNLPYLASLPIDPASADDPYHWDVVYDDKGDEDGISPGVHETCFVGVYTTPENHAILEADPEITRVDNI